MNPVHEIINSNRNNVYLLNKDHFLFLLRISNYWRMNWNNYIATLTIELWCLYTKILIMISGYITRKSLLLTHKSSSSKISVSQLQTHRPKFEPQIVYLRIIDTSKDFSRRKALIVTSITQPNQIKFLPDSKAFK